MLLAACLDVPHLCIVLEFAHRGSLDTLLYGGADKSQGITIDAALALRMAESIARGLAFLHASDPPVIHRDLKPANCFVFEDPGLVKLGCVAWGVRVMVQMESPPPPPALLSCLARPTQAQRVGLHRDFGMSRFKDATATMTQCGTPIYCAPEILSGEHYAEEVDVYAFGVVLFDLFVRQHPFRKECVATGQPSWRGWGERG